MANLITTQLRQAYLRSIYYVFTSTGELEITLNKPSAALDKLLAAHNVVSAAFITAWNPASERLDEVTNSRRNEALQADLESAGFNYFPGKGRDPAGEWPAEQSLLVLGIQAAAATLLAKQYGQNAYVYLVVGHPAELVEV